MRYIKYSEFVNFVSNLNHPFVYSENNYFYFLFLENVPIACELAKDDTLNVADFESNYKSKGNISKDVYDSSGRMAVRHHIANKGNSLQCYAVYFTTAKSGSLYSKKADNSTNETGNTYTMYDNSGLVTVVDANCVHTRVCIERPFDTEFIGGAIFQKTTPASDVHCYMTAVPDIPAGMGGSKVMCQGLNLAFLGGPDKYEMDGRAPLLMPYSATLHTNKMQLDVYHAASLQHDIMLRLEYYWS